MKTLVQDCIAVLTVGGFVWTCLVWLQILEQGALS